LKIVKFYDLYLGNFFMIKKLLLPVLAISFLVNQTAKPVDNNDPRLIGLVALSIGASLSGAWMVKKGTEQIFTPKKNESTAAYAIRSMLGLPVTVIGMGLCAAGISGIFGSKLALQQIDAEAWKVKWASIFG
jgi:hypothetical protein